MFRKEKKLSGQGRNINLRFFFLAVRVISNNMGFKDRFNKTFHAPQVIKKAMGTNIPDYCWHISDFTETHDSERLFGFILHFPRPSK